MKTTDYERKVLKIKPNARLYWGTIGWGVKDGDDVLAMPHHVECPATAWMHAWKTLENRKGGAR